MDFALFLSYFFLEFARENLMHSTSTGFFPWDHLFEHLQVLLGIARWGAMVLREFPRKQVV